ncbi:MAG: hypothetical protein ACRC4M_04010 [Mycoplasma sp.]
MNRQKFINSIIKKRFINSTALKQTQLFIESTNVKCCLNKISTKQELIEHVYPMSSFMQDSFLVFPYINIHSKHFNSDFELLIFDSKYTVMKIIKSDSIKNFNTHSELQYSKIILLSGFCDFNKIKVGDKLFLKHISKVK